MRKIRSYVNRRASRFTESQKRSWDALWPLYGLTFDTETQYDLNKIFNRNSPKILEIGFGDGEALIEMAKTHANQDYIGIEVYHKGVSQCLSKIASHHLTNVRVFYHDATEVLQRLGENSLTAILIFFADPWPKMKHKKRRLIQAEFIENIIKTLKVGGLLHLATDWEDYALHMVKMIAKYPAFKNLSADALFIPRPDNRPLTKYERRGMKLDHKTWDIIFERVDYTNNI